MLTSSLLTNRSLHRLPESAAIMRLPYSIAATLCIGKIVLATPSTHSPSPSSPARALDGLATGSTNATKENTPVQLSPSTSTDTGIKFRRGNPGGCYMCALPGWSGKCRYVVPSMGSCYSFEDWDFWPDGFGPDLEATCFMHR